MCAAIYIHSSLALLTSMHGCLLHLLVSGQEGSIAQLTSVTTPADSCPMTIGALTTKSPMRPCLRKCTSEPQMPTAFIATLT
jgi:nitric oxide reductase large subunit